ncbi:hypothetical protein CCACVL1_21435 [Corchorus capsularis]|uniref:Uncharacterized protein n=1 Tax=Corchorus capsularis TaxID=210143 RepID=A0A1R3H5U9_COCAP|nr:hypothetical protein CCACVL1_21435 [Corchorus capsularis]
MASWTESGSDRKIWNSSSRSQLG